MTVRKSKRRKKYLGKRSHGAGNTKNRRGAGCRGGRGLGGSQKHKANLNISRFGTERKQIIAKKETKAINLDMLVQLLPKWIEEKKVEKTANGIGVDGKKIGFGKILGKSQDLKEKLLIKNLRVSKKAHEKIVAAGGSIEEDTGFEQEEDENPEQEDKQSKEALEGEPEAQEKGNGNKEAKGANE
ncbi:MAG: uL15 family ribosomal protein [Candidatus Diapherotrites archaeon]|nr:uL15 family ribosomal protein [Candidatus Diapherotrites archaeon]